MDGIYNFLDVTITKDFMKITKNFVELGFYETMLAIYMSFIMNY